jgi:hypothetical protein
MPTDRLRVYITVDTETSMGGAWRNPAYAPLPLDVSVFGKCGSAFYGIPLIMDILEEHGFRGTFFTEVFCALVVGHREVERMCQYIRGRGHDCQLHLHPVYRFYHDFRQGKPRREMDLMFQLPADEQFLLIAEGVQLFKDLSGVAPRAYRAGCYGASEVTLRALRQNGLEIDSSYNLAYMGATCGFQTPALNAPTTLEGMLEYPVTTFRVRGVSGYKPLEISAVSVAETLATLRALRRAGCRDVVLSLHSFGFLKNLGVRFDARRPDRIVIRRFRRLCAALVEMRDEVEVAVLGEATGDGAQPARGHAVPTLGLAQASIRKVVQAANRSPWL